MTVTESKVERRASDYALVMVGSPGAKCLTVGYEPAGPADPDRLHQAAVGHGLKALAAEGANPAGYSFLIQEAVRSGAGVYYRTVRAMDFAEAVDVAGGRDVLGSFVQAAGRTTRRRPSEVVRDAAAAYAHYCPEPAKCDGSDGPDVVPLLLIHHGRGSAAE